MRRIDRESVIIACIVIAIVVLSVLAAVAGYKLGVKHTSEGIHLLHKLFGN